MCINMDESHKDGEQQKKASYRRKMQHSDIYVKFTNMQNNTNNEYENHSGQ